jgi:hypothetical protein
LFDTTTPSDVPVLRQSAHAARSAKSVLRLLRGLQLSEHIKRRIAIRILREYAIRERQLARQSAGNAVP